MSYAGVARRTTRRAVAVGAGAGGAAAYVLTPHQAACRSWMPMAGSSRSAIERIIGYCALGLRPMWLATMRATPRFSLRVA